MIFYCHSFKTWYVLHIDKKIPEAPRDLDAPFELQLYFRNDLSCFSMNFFEHKQLKKKITNIQFGKFRKNVHHYPAYLR